MLVLLPPSEGKAAGGEGPPVDLMSMSWPELAPVRQRVGRTLVTVCSGRPARARDVLGLSDALDSARLAGAEIWTSPTMPAGHRYAGVLHDALGYPTLTAAARRRADAGLVTFSGLWGAVRPLDRIPAYRLGVNVRLPRIGPLPALWRRPLFAAMADLVVTDGAIDLRSTGYTQFMQPPRDAEVVTVRIVGVDGTRAASSYQSKVAKGRLVRQMLGSGIPSVPRLIAAADALGLRAHAADKQIVVHLPNGWGMVANRPG